MSGDDFDIDDIQLTRRSAVTTPTVQEKKADPPESPALSAPTAQTASRIEIIEEEEKKPLPAPVMPKVPEESEITVKRKTVPFTFEPKATPDVALKASVQQAAKPPAKKKSKDNFSQASIPNVTAPAVKKRNYALGCCIFSFIVPLLIGAGAAAAVRYWKPIRIQMERFDAWMAKHGLSYDGEDAPWKHKKENDTK